ncbi:MAG: hypothetical protein E7162_00990 [Firmicutes bacterium]|nr:hypothetical protein [Bacillota bacterium]
MTIDEIRSDLLEFIKKERTLDETSKHFELTNNEIMGFIKELTSEGFMISTVIKDNEIQIMNKGTTDFTADNDYDIEIDSDNEKILVISDLNLGSKYQQLSFLNEVYKKAYAEGIRKVIVCGDISAGLISPKNIYYNSLFKYDTQSQAEYIIDNFPKLNGMKTYFITGEKDHTHEIKNSESIGKMISDKRKDMIYFGPNHCTVNLINKDKETGKILNQAKILVRHPKGKVAYTLSYKPQQYISSMRSEDKVDMVLHGHFLQCEKMHFRGVDEISVPGMTATTPKMKDDGANNTVGAWILDIKLKKKGIEKVVPTLIPCYQTIQNDYLYSKPLSSTKDKTTHVKNETEKHIDKIYNFIKNGTRFEDFIKEMNISMTEGYGLVETMKLYGKPIELNMTEDGSLIFHKKKKTKTTQYTSKDKEGLIETNICVISDTHLGTKEQQLTLINEVYKEAHRRGIKIVLHIGDVLDGDYTQIRKEQTYQLFLRGFDEQVGYVIDMYPHIDGITTYFIQGSHDETHLKNGGATAGAWIDRCRDDMIYLGQDKATFKINNLRILMDHPGGGNAKSYSYKPQQAIEGLNPGEKPNILLQGHYHKSYYMFYRNVHSLLVPCIVNQSQFMKKMNLQNIVGAYFLKIYSDDKGNIHYFEPEEHLFSTKDLIENDYLKCKKLDIRLPKKDKK